MDRADVRATLERQLRAATSPWDRLPILIALTRELNQRDPQSVHRYAVEALTLAKELNDPFWTACSLCALSIQPMTQGHYSEALYTLKEASAIFARLNDLRMKAEADLIIARTYIVTGEFPDAMSMLLELLTFFRTLREPYWITFTLCAIGDIYRLTGDWITGLQYYRRAGVLIQRRDVQSQGGLVYHRLATCYRLMGDIRGYRKYMFRSLAVCRENCSKSGIAIALGNIGNSYIDQKLFDNAEKYVRQSGKLYRELGYVRYEAMAWARLGTIYENKGKLDQAFRYFRKGLSLARRGEEAVILGNIYENFGMLCIRMGRRSRGFFYLHKAVEILTQAAEPQDRYKVYETLATACEITGDAQNALEYYRQSRQIREEYLNSQKILEAAFTEMRARFQPVARQLRKERSRNNALRKIIEQKEAELLSLTLGMIQDEEEKSGVKNRGPVRKKPGTQAHRGSGLSENWNTFARQFHKVHHQFYASLVHRYPDLTATEVKVCSLIRIGLSSKEIAGVLCVSRRTIDSHRVRIHRKMALPPGSSLGGFIVTL